MCVGSRSFGIWRQISTLAENGTLAGPTLLLAMFGSEFVQILLVCPVLLGLLVLGELVVILLLHLLRLSLAGFFACEIQALPALTDELCDFGKGQILTFEDFSYF